MLTQGIVYLLAAVIGVAIVRRAGFGSILGYLLAGVAIGPAGLKLVSDVEDTLHFAELGVLMMLFVIGLELKPSRLWLLRKPIFVSGGLQVLLSTAALALLGVSLGLSTATAAVIGVILALSSTAFVLQMLAERKELTTKRGRAAFTILLFQDLAVIPLLALLPLLGAQGSQTPAELLSGTGIAVAAIGGLLVGGRFLLRPVLRFAARSGATEIFTATALLVVIGSAGLMDWAGLSMGLGTFLAGVLLADSEYRHALEADLEPFKGLLLGLFFIAVGMSMDLGIVVAQPAVVIGLTLSLLVVKGAAIWLAARLSGASGDDARGLAFTLPQGGEFAFVLAGVALGAGIITLPQQNMLIVVVTLSMALTPFLVQLNAMIDQRASRTERDFDSMEDENNPVIIAGFGRFGQITGRILSSMGIGFTALESSSAQVDFVRRFGNRVFYGDVARPELLHAAGAGQAKLLLLAIDDPEKSVAVVRTVKEHYPDLPIIARARDRQHALALMDLGISDPIRETYHSGLKAAEETLARLGVRSPHSWVRTFEKHDEKTLQRQKEHHTDESALIQSAREAAAELEALFKDDASKR